MAKYDNEFEPVQSDAALRTLVQGLEKQVQSLSTSLQSAQDTFSKLQEFQSTLTKTLNEQDVGTDEAQKILTTGESTAAALRRLIHVDNAKTGVDAFVETIVDKWSNTKEQTGQRLSAKQAMDSDDRFWTNMIRMKTVAGEVDPDSLVEVMRTLGKKDK